MGYSWTAESFGRVDEVAWAAAAGDDLAMDLRLLRCFEHSMAGQCRCWAVLIREAATGKPAAAAAVGLFGVDGLDTMGRAARRLARVARRVWPGFLRFGVLFCGLPVPAGHSHLRIVPGVEPGPVLRALDAALRGIARRERARLVVIKELRAGAADEAGAALGALGYLRRPVLPAYALKGLARFGGMAGYVAAMRAGYRREINKSVRRFGSANLRVLRASGDQMAALYTDELHELYLAVHERAEYRLERLPAAFFRGMARAFGDLAQLTLVLGGERRDTPVGFAASLTAGDVRYALYAGMDYAQDPAHEVYFNLFFLDLQRAMEAGVRELHLGQTAGEFKTRLGAQAEPLELFVRGVHPAVQAALRLTARWAFPPVQAPPERRVFRDGHESGGGKT